MFEKEDNLTMEQTKCNGKNFQAHINLKIKNNNFSKNGQLKLEKILSSKFNCFDLNSEEQENNSFGNLMKIKAKSTLKDQKEKEILKNLHFDEIKDEISNRKKFKSIVLTVNDKPKNEITLINNYRINPSSFFNNRMFLPTSDIHSYLTQKFINYDKNTIFYNIKQSSNNHDITHKQKFYKHKIHKKLLSKHFLKNNKEKNLFFTKTRNSSVILIPKTKKIFIDIKNTKTNDVKAVFIQKQIKTKEIVKQQPPIDNLKHSRIYHKKTRSIVFKNKKHSTEPDMPEIFYYDLGTPVDLENFKKTLNIADIDFYELPKNPVKIKEASFSHVFKVNMGNNTLFLPTENYLILKIIDFNDFYTEANFVKEVFTLKTLERYGYTCKFNYSCIATGDVSQDYISALNSYKSCSEAITPFLQSKSKRYGCVFMENGGEDLETFNFKNFEESHYFMTTLIKMMINLQNELKYEHRDLHWGNVLINRKDSTEKNNCVVNDYDQIQKNTKLDINLIDFSLSRFSDNNFLVYTDFENKKHNWIFEGDASEDNQFEVYRSMKTHTKSWADFNEYNNVLWIKYLIEKVYGKTQTLNNNACIFYKKAIENLKDIKTLEELLKYFIDNKDKHN
ncbi:hrk1 [Ecytonucleospora hepatopenaei]|uniref:non-specific serine/threonine protein kinase n=1 Tax=Ecytonucleospora hepatopenaei TaxID=646526 RepID=A0A1W0E997_9MICR|nr:hrk1 [Ecytonucleospora hepatopenaei]